MRKVDYYCEGQQCPVKNVCYYHFTSETGIDIQKCTNQKLFVRIDG